MWTYLTIHTGCYVNPSIVNSLYKVGSGRGWWVHGTRIDGYKGATWTYICITT